jgi:hypothetical protein
MSDNPAPLGRLKNGNPRGNPANSPRCGAKTRAGSVCRQPAMKNGRCRLHGGKSPGAPRGERNGNYRHGLRTIEAVNPGISLVSGLVCIRNSKSNASSQPIVWFS